VPLPDACRAREKPVCVLRNMFTAGDAATEGFVESLEAECMIEAVGYGEVLSLLALEGTGYYEGCVAITFGDVSGAEACAHAMHERPFDGRTLLVQPQGPWGERVYDPSLDEEPPVSPTALGGRPPDPNALVMPGAVALPLDGGTLVMPGAAEEQVSEQGLKDAADAEDFLMGLLG